MTLQAVSRPFLFQGKYAKMALMLKCFAVIVLLWGECKRLRSLVGKCYEIL